LSIVHVPLYPSDWLAGTRGLSAEETGVYITLVCRMYEMAGPIERDDARLSRLCGCKSKPAFVRALDYLISEGKITETPDGLFNDKAEKVLRNVTEKSAQAREAAERRWKKKDNKNKDSEMQTHSPRICETDANQSPKPNIPEPNGSGVVDFEKAIFERGVQFLCEHGRSEAQARALVGKWRRDHTAERVFAAFSEAKKAGVTEPVAYITAVLQPQPSASEEIAKLAQEGRI
jgi:uncharacterized protein YdaU (DUF1376 family)